MKIGLYFGSFNPIHVGHLIIANHMAYHTDLDKVWLVVTPQNPLKSTTGLLNEYDRLHLVELAIGEEPRLRASNVEFSLPRPSYTIDTLAYLAEKYPMQEFAVVLGSDSLQNLPRWKNYEMILQHFSLYVYLRPGYPAVSYPDARITVVKAPFLDISSSHIRKMIKEGKSVRYLVTSNVYDYIKNNHYYLH